ncbi:hypothetical protein GCM10023321_43320 [Pseudonocardia eucalypti]|uniref:Uncharacterized protein n=1 Tax=Pseudonocardia eucalypti TaxID=648755 RepID=A0ABP9QEK6_9PSEU
MDATLMGVDRRRAVRWAVVALLALVTLAFAAPCATPSPDVTVPVARPSDSSCPHGPGPGLSCLSELATVGVRQRADATGSPTDGPLGAVSAVGAAPLLGAPTGAAVYVRAHPPPEPAGRDLLTSLSISRT